MAKLFTPNVTKGDFDGNRYVLYRRGSNLFSISPRGKTFRAKYEPDACGLGCECGAYLSEVSAAGARLLEKAAQIDRMSERVTR
jgi:hypothetical protein